MNRKADYPITPAILNRWSSRAMSGEPLSNEELFSLFEAARWAPSCYNEQPWRFIYAKKDSKHWPLFLDLLVPFNKEWAQKAAVLVVVASQKLFTKNQKPIQTHSYDTGAAWQNLALEGSIKGLVVHGMQGFDYKKAATDLQIPDQIQIEAMIAIGKPAPKESLPAELQAKETPNSRKPIQDWIHEGVYEPK